MDDLIMFYRARLDEVDPDAFHDLTQCDLAGSLVLGSCTCKVPDMVRRDLEAKRRILDVVLPEILSMESQIDLEWGCGGDPTDDASGPLLRFLALPYSDHPGYQKEWKL